MALPYHVALPIMAPPPPPPAPSTSAASTLNGTTAADAADAPPTVSAPEGAYTLHHTVVLDKAAWAALPVSERDIPVRVEVAMHAVASGHMSRARSAGTNPGTVSRARRQSPAGLGDLTAHLSSVLPVAGANGTPAAVGGDPLLSPIPGTPSSAGFDAGGEFPFATRSLAAGGAHASVPDVIFQSTSTMSQPSIPVAVAAPIPVPLASSSSSSTSRLGSLFSSTARRHRTKSMVSKSNSTFVAKITTLDHLPDVLRTGNYATHKEVTHVVGDSHTHMHGGAVSLAAMSVGSVASSGAINMGGASLVAMRELKEKQLARERAIAVLNGGSDKDKDKNRSHGHGQSGGSSGGRLRLARGFFSSKGSSKSAPNLATDSNGADHPVADVAAVKQETALPQEPSVLSTMIFNLGKGLVWMEAQEYKTVLWRIQFIRAIPTCHAINPTTRAPGRMDLIVGFHTGDLMWYDAVHHRYHRINKQGALHARRVTQVAWVPGSETLFLATFADGTVMIFDKDREDRELDVSKDAKHGATNGTAAGQDDEVITKHSAEGFEVIKPVKAHKYNPLSVWQVGKFHFGSGKAIVDVSFSPNGKYVALVGLDGHLQIVKFAEERLTDTFSSFFGGLLCLCWSPDSRLLLTGGQDDLITVWSIQERRVLARCRGHTSWVSSIAFDYWRSDASTYRFGSVGQDGKMLLWELPVHGLGPLGRPAGARSTSFTGSVNRRASFLSGNDDDWRAREHIIHPPLPANEVPVMEPIMCEVVSTQPLTSLSFTPTAIIVAQRKGAIQVWTRPPPTHLVDDDSVVGKPGVGGTRPDWTPPAFLNPQSVFGQADPDPDNDPLHHPWSPIGFFTPDSSAAGTPETRSRAASGVSGWTHTHAAFDRSSSETGSSAAVPALLVDDHAVAADLAQRVEDDLARHAERMGTSPRSMMAVRHLRVDDDHEVVSL
ncbi:hypothetical protein GGF32_006265 [Allomyces javanicus]|nr:hypothetical protein GGF32_006265 [Allomyces javanicus]